MPREIEGGIASNSFADCRKAEPFRTEGGTRRYSSHDVERIGQITTLLATGLNLAGVEHVLRLQAETERLQATIDQLRRLLSTSAAASSGKTARQQSKRS